VATIGHTWGNKKGSQDVLNVERKSSSLIQKNEMRQKTIQLSFRRGRIFLKETKYEKSEDAG